MLSQNDIFILEQLKRKNGIKKIRRFFERKHIKDPKNESYLRLNETRNHSLDDQLATSEIKRFRNEDQLKPDNQPHPINTLTLSLIIKELTTCQIDTSSVKTLYVVLKHNKNLISSNHIQNQLLVLFTKEDDVSTGSFVILCEHISNVKCQEYQKNQQYENKYICSKLSKYTFKLLNFLSDFKIFVPYLFRISIYSRNRKLIKRITRLYDVDIPREFMNDILNLKNTFDIIKRCSINTIIRYIYTKNELNEESLKGISKKASKKILQRIKKDYLGIQDDHLILNDNLNTRNGSIQKDKIQKDKLKTHEKDKFYNIYSFISSFIQNDQNFKQKLNKKYIISLFDDLLNSRYENIKLLKAFSPDESSIYHFIYRLYKTKKRKKDKISKFYYFQKLNEELQKSGFEIKENIINYLIEKLSTMSTNQFEYFLQSIRIDNLRIISNDLRIKKCFFLSLRVNITRKSRNLNKYYFSRKYKKNNSNDLPSPPFIEIPSLVPFKKKLIVKYNKNINEYDFSENELVIRSNYFGRKIKFILKIDEKEIAHKKVFVKMVL